MKASKALTVSMSILRGRIWWRFSLSKINIAPAAPCCFPFDTDQLSTHTKQQQDKVFETDFIGSQNPPPPHDAHLLALSHIYIYIYKYCYKQCVLKLCRHELSREAEREAWQTLSSLLNSPEIRQPSNINSAVTIRPTTAQVHHSTLHHHTHNNTGTPSKA